MAKKLWLLSILFLFAAILFAQDSTAYHGRAGIADVADEDPGLFMVMMIVLVGLITAVILGLIVLSIMFVSLTALVVGGIMSFSVVMAIYRKSLRTGIKTMIYTSGLLLGAGAGVFGYFIFNLFRHTHLQSNHQLLFSIVGGMAGGVIGGWVALKFISGLYSRLKPNL